MVFEKFGFLDRRVVEFLLRVGVEREGVGRGLVVGDGIGREVIIVCRGLVGVSVMFGYSGERVEAPKLEVYRYIPLVGVYGRGDVVIDLYVSRNVNFYAEVLSREADLLIIRGEDFDRAIEMDRRLNWWLMNEMAKMVSRYGFLINLRHMKGKERLKFAKSLFGRIPKIHMARLCGLARETLSRIGYK